MTLFRSRRRVSREESLAIVSAAASLSSMFGVAWTVEDRVPQRSATACADALRRGGRRDATLRLPREARDWFDLDFDAPEAGYALAFVLVWSLAATDTAAETSGRDHVRVAMWHLTHLLPASAHRVLPDIEDALRSAGRPPRHAVAGLR
ncbi:hypothetical protein [Micromonospora sp. AKA38]|uniref:hypothetical protein n=1 Tax=Micromonospora sp. AKA38 TaxID=2733861 RepID=UPI0022CCD0A5|nr:hypothetical protein [Micromonospora sp. AKA38]GHJ17066.1 hypothetical protein TPA0908_50610 [Micromonospora sp. AKA38]